MPSVEPKEPSDFWMEPPFALVQTTPWENGDPNALDDSDTETSRIAQEHRKILIQAFVHIDRIVNELQTRTSLGASQIAKLWYKQRAGGDSDLETFWEVDPLDGHDTTVVERGSQFDKYTDEVIKMVRSHLSSLSLTKEAPLGKP
jgi:hypothetical protein